FWDQVRSDAGSQGVSFQARGALVTVWLPFGNRPLGHDPVTQCPGQGSNLHGGYPPGDFKSPASAIPPPGLIPAPPTAPGAAPTPTSRHVLLAEGIASPRRLPPPRGRHARRARLRCRRPAPR